MLKSQKQKIKKNYYGLDIHSPSTSNNWKANVVELLYLYETYYRKRNYKTEKEMFYGFTVEKQAFVAYNGGGISDKTFVRFRDKELLENGCIEAMDIYFVYDATEDHVKSHNCYRCNADKLAEFYFELCGEQITKDIESFDKLMKHTAKYGNKEAKEKHIRSEFERKAQKIGKIVCTHEEEDQIIRKINEEIPGLMHKSLKEYNVIRSANRVTSTRNPERHEDSTRYQVVFDLFKMPGEEYSHEYDKYIKTFDINGCDLRILRALNTLEFDTQQIAKKCKKNESLRANSSNAGDIFSDEDIYETLYQCIYGRPFENRQLRADFKRLFMPTYMANHTSAYDSRTFKEYKLEKKQVENRQLDENEFKVNEQYDAYIRIELALKEPIYNIRQKFHAALVSMFGWAAELKSSIFAYESLILARIQYRLIQEGYKVVLCYDEFIFDTYHGKDVDVDFTKRINTIWHEEFDQFTNHLSKSFIKPLMTKFNKQQKAAK